MRVEITGKSGNFHTMFYDHNRTLVSELRANGEWSRADVYSEEGQHLGRYLTNGKWIHYWPQGHMLPTRSWNMSHISSSPLSRLFADTL